MGDGDTSRMMTHVLKSLFILLFFSCSLQAAEQASDGYQPAIASAHPLATDAGIEILQKGGNAFDAAVAVTATLAVVEPYSSGLGGGGFWLLHIADKNRNVMLDGRERAPLAASRDMYLDERGNVKQGASINGPLSAGIPGTVAAMENLARQYGRLPLSTSLEAAIRHASEGFEVDEHYRRMAGFRLQPLLASKDAAKTFLHNNKVPEPGALIVQPDLAKTLEVIAEQGAKGFYKGEIAQKMVTSVKQHGGIWSLKDLDDYKVVERAPTVIVYKGMKFVTASPPSSGGLALSQMLNMLSNYEIEKKDQVARTHLLAEIMRRAYRDRAEFLGDPDFVDVPGDRLTSTVYTNKLIKSIRKSAATPSSELKPVAEPTGKGADTTHFSIIDKDGNRVSATLSINYPFGSGFVAEGTGILLNDEMDDFSAKPGEPNVYGLVGAEANAIEPGKRMLSSMSPSFLETAERTAILGTPGGSRIITMVLLATLDFYQGASAKQMVELGRFHHQYLPDRIFYEPGVFNEKAQSGLTGLGHALEEMDDTYGNMQVVVVNKKSKTSEAASDPRGVGKATVIR
jgi:gamma-glutamyltranspeptidase/glutathione hydrolase